MTPDTPKYMIGVAAALLDMHPQTLRMYEARGVVTPRRTAGGTRLYSDADLARIRRITDLTAGQGFTRQGAEHALRLEDEVSALRRRVRELEGALEDAERTLRREIDRVHRSYRRELVLYHPPGSAIELRRPRRSVPQTP